jgi:23S rRNA (uracil-5-)-methyltransferase RumA
MRKGNTYEFNIEETEFQGLGVANVDGLKVYIKNTVPGQKVMARVSKKRKEYAEAKVVEILEHSKDEIEAACKHFSLCGGCTHQFLSYENQLKLKEEQVLKLFKNANIDGFEFLGIEKSPLQFEYRNKMEFTFGDLEKGGELTLGMHIPGQNFGIVTVDECMLVDNDVTEILKATVNYFNEKKLPYYKVLKHEGYLRNLVVRNTKNTEEILVNLVTTSQIEFDMNEFKELILGLNLKATLKGILHTTNDSLSDTVAADKVDILYGEDYITENLLGLNFKISPFSFFQTNSKGAEDLYSIVRDFMGNADDKVVFDLYCGTGTIGQITAAKAKKVIGVELIAEAVDRANENAKLNGLDNCKFIAGDVAKVIQTINEKPDIIILDPPRSGVHPVALDYVIKFNPQEIIYVSCNPKTLMVDLKVLIDKGYEVKMVKAMDMFPHTSHLETVVKLIKQ